MSGRSGESPVAAAADGTAATRASVDTTTLVRALDLYPVTFHNTEDNKNIKNSPGKRPADPVRGLLKHSGAPTAASQLRARLPLPLPNNTTTGTLTAQRLRSGSGSEVLSAAAALCSVGTYRSTQTQLNGRVAAALSERLSAMLNSRLQERRQQVAQSEMDAAMLRCGSSASLTPPSSARGDSSSSLGNTARQKTVRVIESSGVIHVPGIENGEAAEAAAESHGQYEHDNVESGGGGSQPLNGLMTSFCYTHPSKQRPTSSTATTAFFAGTQDSLYSDDLERPCNTNGTGGGQHANSKDGRGGSGGGLAVRTLAGSYPLADRRRLNASTASAMPPPPGSTVSVEAPADFGAIELVRVQRLRGIPDHNRGLFAGPQTPAYVTRSGNLMLGVRAAGGNRVRPAAWCSLWGAGAANAQQQQQQQQREAPLTGLTSNNWLARYQAGRAVATRSSGGSSIVMRSFGSNGHTYFQWVRSTAEGQRPGSTGYFGSDEEDVDGAVDRIVSARYGRALTAEERAEALRRLASRRNGQPPGSGHHSGDGLAGFTGEGAEGAWADGAGDPLSGSGSHLLGRQSSCPGSHGRPGTGRYAADGTMIGGRGGTGPYDSSLDWGTLVLSGAESSTAGSHMLDAMSPYSKGISTSTVAGTGNPLNRTLTAEEAEQLAREGHLGLNATIGTDGKPRGGYGKKDGAASLTGAEYEAGAGGAGGAGIKGRGKPGSALRGGQYRRRGDDGELITSSQLRGSSAGSCSWSSVQQRRHGGGSAGAGAGRGAARPSSFSNTLPDLHGAEDADATAKLSDKPTAGAEQQAGALEGTIVDVELEVMGEDGKPMKVLRRMRRRPDGTLEPIGGDGEAEDKDAARQKEEGQLNMFLANFPDSEEHVKLRRQANNILAGLENFDDANTFPLPSFADEGVESIWSSTATSPGYGGRGTGAGRGRHGKGGRKENAEPAITGFQLNETKLREKFLREALTARKDLVALRDQLHIDVANQTALKNAFSSDIKKLSEGKTGAQFAVELTREVNNFAKEHNLTLRQIIQDDELMDGDVEEVAEGFLDRFWKAKVESRDVACQVHDEDLGYVDEGVRTVEAHMQDLFYHEQGLLTAIRLATIAVANIMSFHSSLELESTCKECFFLFDHPRTLWPCGHTFCQQCLTGMYNKRDELICAECGSVCEVGYTPNLSVELIANYQLVQGSGNEELPGTLPGTSSTAAGGFAYGNGKIGGSGGGGRAVGSSHAPTQTIEGVLRTLLGDLVATQRGCSGGQGIDGRLAVQKTA